MRKTACRGVNERGAALAGVILIGAIIGALGLVLAFSVWSRLASARYARDEAEAHYVARVCLEASAGWFEFAERAALVPPPGVGEVTRHRRGADDRVYKATSDALFRAPDGPDEEDRFLGQADAPDLLLESEGRGAAKLEELMRALGAPADLPLVRLAFFAPPHAAREGTIASAECSVEIRRAGIGRRRLSLRAEIWRVPWDPLLRPLVVEGNLSVSGEASWRQGEAWIGGELTSDVTAESSWPSSIPWAGPDEPWLDDHDGDGVPDDADGDALPDLQAWRDEPGAVEDPWWRARVGGSWNGMSRASCSPARPFGPRDTPPRAPERESERSGLLVGCAPLDIEARPAAWAAFESLRGRGVIRASESRERPGLFIPEWGGTPRPAPDLLPAEGALLLLQATPGGPPLEWTLSGERGGLVLGGRDLRVAASSARSRAARVPPPPASRAADLIQPLGEVGAPCTGWDPAPWRPPNAGERGARECPARALHLEGLLVSEGHLELGAGLRIAGQIRAGTLELAGGFPETRIETRPESFDVDRSRPGPPGAPRVVALGVRRVRR